MTCAKQTHTFIVLRPLEPRVRRVCAQIQENVRAIEGMCTLPVAHTVVTATWVRNALENPHTMTILNYSTMNRSIWLLTTNCQMSESILNHGFPKQARLLILGDAFV